MVSAAKLLRTYHDATESFITPETFKLSWMLPVKEPAEVIVHGDFAPYNVALKGNRAVGIIDFDTAHPAPRLWDIAYAVYRWLGLQFLSRSWFNLELIWALSLIFVGILGLWSAI